MQTHIQWRSKTHRDIGLRRGWHSQRGKWQADRRLLLRPVRRPFLCKIKRELKRLARIQRIVRAYVAYLTLQPIEQRYRLPNLVPPALRRAVKRAAKRKFVVAAKLVIHFRRQFPQFAQ